MRSGEAAAALMLWAAAALAQPADPEPSGPKAAPPSQGPAAEAVQARPQPRARTPAPAAVEQELALPAETVDANDVLDEMLDELAADMAKLGSVHSSLSLDVELVKADDGTIAFAEGYRVHPNTAQIFRSADRAQKREARLKDLEDRLAQRPQFGTGLFVGAMLIPSDSPNGSVVGAH